MQIPDEENSKYHLGMTKKERPGNKKGEERIGGARRRKKETDGSGSRGKLMPAV